MSTPDAFELHASLSDDVRADVGTPGPQHEALFELLVETVMERMQDKLPTLATVKGAGAGGSVRVHLDDEDEERQLGMPRDLGKQYRNGDRVWVMKGRTGGEGIVGHASSAGGADQRRVTDADLDDKSVRRQAIQDTAVDTSKLADGAVETGKLKNGAVTKDKLAPKAVGTSELEDNSVNNSKLANDSVGTGNLKQEVNNKFAGANHSHSEYLKDSALSGYLKSGDVRSEAKGQKPLATEEWVKANYEPKKKSSD